jgi:two-component system nitrogen regulation sensor histidine kinase NtrY
MSLKTKLLLLVTLSIAASVGAVAWLIEARTRKSFREVNQERTQALVAQFRREFDREGDEITSAVSAIAKSEPVLEMALKLSGGADSAAYVNQAASDAGVRHLDFLDLLAPDGTIISSAHWFARFGYKERWFMGPASAIPQQTFLRQVETPQGDVLGILCIRAVPAHGANFYVIGGRKLDSALLQSLATPAGMRILIYSSPEQGSSGFLSSTSDSFDPDKLMPLVQKALQQPHDEPSDTIEWSNSSAQESFHAMALRGFGDKPAAVLLVGNSLARQQELEAHIEKVSLLIALFGVALGLILSSVIATHITRPVQELAVAATQIGSGNWQVHVEPASRDEIGQLAQSFNQMTQELIAQ